MKQKNFLKRLLAKNNKSRKCILLYLMIFASLLNAQNALGQERTISGKVVDENNEPLPGLTIIIKGTTIGTQTDFNGLYSLSVPESNDIVLDFHFLGYTLQSINVGTAKVIDVVMVPDMDALDEVVVVGYGTQKKQSVVGAIGTTSAKDLKQTGNSSNLTDALTGMIPGLSVLSTSGLPGGDFESNTNFTTSGS